MTTFTNQHSILKTVTKVIRYLLFLFSFPFLTNCTKEKNINSNDDFLKIDTTLIGVKIYDKNLGIKFNTPKNWLLTPTLASKKEISLYGKGIKGQEKFIFTPTYVFFNTTTSGLLNVGMVVFEDSGRVSNANFELYKSTLSQKLNPNLKAMVNFTKAGMNFTYFKGEQQNFVWITLVCSNLKGSVIQFNYNSVKQNYALEENAIQSSIATILPVK
ncbi:hypothetical protein ABRY23_08890 [Melioribacteraceae bacterium 4301-Me]|uniref:hypothetical protein n=1 Tax=Pyranulibacter aquaticus TaxID=3163344 RepID=UPI0035954822